LADEAEKRTGTADGSTGDSTLIEAGVVNRRCSSVGDSEMPGEVTAA